MAVQVETLDKLERRITLTLPASTIASEVESRLRRLSRTVLREQHGGRHVEVNDRL